MGDALSVAAVIPAYNAAATLRRAISSVLGQTEPPNEVIIVDDGSTDGTRAIALEYGSAVRCLSQPNGGASAARNRGIEASRADWVAFLDADDEWRPEKLARQRALLAARPQLAWCFAHMEGMAHERVITVPIAVDIAAALEADPVLPFFVAVRRGLSAGTCGALIRRDALVAAGGFDVRHRIAEDRDLWWRIARVHREVGYVSEVSWRYYIDISGSLMRGSTNRTHGLQVVSEHLAWWQGRSQNDFEPYGRELALDYLVRDACGDITIDRQVRAAALAQIGLRPAERRGLDLVRHLPAWLSRRLLARWRLP